MTTFRKNVALFPMDQQDTPEAVLKVCLTEAQLEEWSDVLVLGFDNGQLVVRSSDMTNAMANWLCDCAKNVMLNDVYEK